MIAVVYSGSNYADWRLADKGRTVASFKTGGINPYFSDEKGILQILNKNINLIHHAEEVKRIHFFGAGGSTPQLRDVIKNALAGFFKFARITVQHDIEAAAIACCKNNPGIVSICGSGSNAAWYNGKKVIPNNYGLGYVLGDEGSGNWLGRQILKHFVSETLPETTRKKFVKQFELDRKIILDKVYRQKHPALFLSSFTDFFYTNSTDAYVKHTVKTGFDKLIKTYILPLTQEHPDMPVHFAGSVVAGFEDLMRESGEENGITIEHIIKEPINNLLSYYTNKN